MTILFFSLLFLSTNLFSMDNGEWTGYQNLQSNSCKKCETLREDLTNKTAEEFKRGREHGWKERDNDIASATNNSTIKEVIKNESIDKINNKSDWGKFSLAGFLLLSASLSGANPAIGGLIAVGGIGTTPFAFIKYAELTKQFEGKFFHCLGMIFIMPVWIAGTATLGCLIAGAK